MSKINQSKLIIIYVLCLQWCNIKLSNKLYVVEVAVVVVPVNSFVDIFLEWVTNVVVIVCAFKKYCQLLFCILYLTANIYYFGDCNLTEFGVLFSTKSYFALPKAGQINLNGKLMEMSDLVYCELLTYYRIGIFVIMFCCVCVWCVCLYFIFILQVFQRVVVTLYLVFLYRQFTIIMFLSHLILIYI